MRCFANRSTLTRDLDRRLRESAKRAREIGSAVVREALEEYLAREERRWTPPEDNPVLQMAGMFEGNPDCREVSGDPDRHLVNPPRDKRGCNLRLCRYLLLVLLLCKRMPTMSARLPTRRLQKDGVLHLSTLIAAEAQRLILHKLGIESGRRFLDQLFIQVERRFVYLLPVTWETTVQARRILSAIQRSRFHPDRCGKRRPDAE